MNQDTYDKVLDRLRVLCSRREYSSADMLKKAAEYLARYDCEAALIPQAAADILSSLRKDRYVDDLRYASAFARDKAGIAGWGQMKIRYSLSVKGIPDDVISEALGNIDSDSAGARLEKIAEVKLKSLEGDPQWKLKLLKFILGRGYSYPEAAKAVETAAHRRQNE